MSHQLGIVKNTKTIAWWAALWAAALLLSTVAFFIGFGTKQASAADTAAYAVTDLGTLGGEVSQGYDVNENGQATGFSATTNLNERGDFAAHAFLWQNGQMQDLGTLGGASAGSGGYDINNNGQVVGVSSTGNGEQERAFLWQNGQMQDLGTLGGDSSVAYGVNNNGQVVGWAHTGSGEQHVYLWENGQMRDLGTLGGSYSAAYGINDQGQVVGYSQTSNGEEHAFLWENGQMRDIGTLGGTYSYADEINNNGQAVGHSEIDGSSRTLHTFLYENGQMQDIGTSGGTHAFDINDQGQAVGLAGNAPSHAVLYENGQMRDLNSFIPQDSGWNLRQAIGINDMGQIVGNGVINVINGQGDHAFRDHAFLLTPPQTSVDSASQSVVAGGTVSTSTGGGTASPSDPVNTSITTPVAGTVSIQETSVSRPEPTGFSFFGQQVNIEAPQASVQNPLSLKFVVDSSLMPEGTNYANLQLFRDGVRIEPCDSGSSSTTASPDPCIKQRSQLSDGDAAITVLSSHASAWNLGVANAASTPSCTKTGTANAETIKGTAGADVICAGGGNDTVKGLGGNDTLKGEAGNDKLLGGVGNDALDGGLGTDTASYSGSLTAVAASLATNAATGEGSDTFTGVENLLGSSKVDTLTGSDANNILTGGGGNDTLRAGSGKDKVVGSGGSDLLYGEDGSDAVNSKDGVNGNDSLDGGAGTDTKTTDATEKSIVGFP